MKKSLVLLSFVLAFSTAGLMAQAATAPVPAANSPTKTLVAKGGKKHGKHHGKKHHKKKGG